VEKLMRDSAADVFLLSCLVITFFTFLKSQDPSLQDPSLHHSSVPITSFLFRVQTGNPFFNKIYQFASVYSALFSAHTPVFCSYPSLHHCHFTALRCHVASSLVIQGDLQSSVFSVLKAICSYFVFSLTHSVIVSNVTLQAERHTSSLSLFN